MPPAAERRPCDDACPACVSHIARRGRTRRSDDFAGSLITRTGRAAHRPLVGDETALELERVQQRRREPLLERRDALVARFRIARIDSGLVTALITGMTTRVTTDHIAILAEPPKPWWKGITFWAGTVFGVVIGALIAGG